MSGSAPSDLSVAFRSFARRHREVQESAADADRAADAAPHLAAATATVAAAAGALSLAPAEDLAATGAAVATAIDGIDADDWTEELLERLRALATETGQHLRKAADAIT